MLRGQGAIADCRLPRARLGGDFVLLSETRTFGDYFTWDRGPWAFFCRGLVMIVLQVSNVPYPADQADCGVHSLYRPGGLAVCARYEYRAQAALVIMVAGLLTCAGAALHAMIGARGQVLPRRSGLA